MLVTMHASASVEEINLKGSSYQVPPPPLSTAFHQLHACIHFVFGRMEVVTWWCAIQRFFCSKQAQKIRYVLHSKCSTILMMTNRGHLSDVPMAIIMTTAKITTVTPASATERLLLKALYYDSQKLIYFSTTLRLSSKKNVCIVHSKQTEKKLTSECAETLGVIRINDLMVHDVLHNAHFVCLGNSDNQENKKSENGYTFLIWQK